jgi:anti-sigma regulatory factor (Ser/Thr protein kinase)
MDGVGSRFSGRSGLSLASRTGGRPSMTDLALTLEPVADSVPLARHELDFLTERLDELQLEKLRLLVSEVVSNGVRHGDGIGPIELRVTVGSSSVRVEVEDPGHGFRPEPGTGPADRTDGWGLLLVERLAARWGVVASGTTLVWFELDLRAG